MASAFAPPPEACHGCWRADQREVFRLPCDHVFCAACLASRARSAMKAPETLLPLRCCEVPVPAAVLASVLRASELAFYRYLTAHEVARKKQLVPGVRLSSECDLCGRMTQLAEVEDLGRLQPCGQLYCDACLAGLQASTNDGGALCCQVMARRAAARPPTPSEIAVPIAIPLAHAPKRKAAASSAATPPRPRPK